MRKLLLLIAFLPLIAAVGHDIYNFTENQEKGFHFADLGWIWAKYDPQSHQQVRDELNTLIEEGETNKTPIMSAEPVIETTEEGTKNEETTDPIDDGTATIRVKVQTNHSNMPNSGEIIGNAAGFVAFLMQQKAVVVAACFAALMLVLMRLCGAVKLGGGKRDMDDMDELSGKKKGVKFKYNRK